MGGEVESIGFAEARSALAWWLDAGVDVAVQEEPRDWLKPPPEAAAREPSRTAAPPNITQPSHETLAELQDWLASSVQLPLASATAKRILPHGPENAAIMLLSDAPTFEDLPRDNRSAAKPGCSRKRMLAAIGIAARAGL